MDTGQSDQPADKVAQGLHTIKAHMPLVYGAIQDKAAEIGNEAFALVRKGLRGEPNAFYAFERGYVVGTPFSAGELTKDVAALMVQFGMAFVCIWRAPGAATQEGGQDGQA